MREGSSLKVVLNKKAVRFVNYIGMSLVFIYMCVHVSHYITDLKRTLCNSHL